jgi:hypothetical protein
VGLKYDVYLAEAALPGSRQRGASLGRMMAVVIDHAYPGGLAPQLEAPVHPAEIFKGCADVIGFYVETDSHRDGCSGIQNVMHSRHVQPEFAEIAIGVGRTKMADWLPVF